MRDRTIAGAIEFWAQNLFDKNYMQVAFDCADPGHAGTTTRGVSGGLLPVATQLYGGFLGEPRTFGVTLRGKLGFDRPAPRPMSRRQLRRRRPAGGRAGDAASAAASAAASSDSAASAAS